VVDSSKHKKNTAWSTVLITYVGQMYMFAFRSFAQFWPTSSACGRYRGYYYWDVHLLNLLH